MINPARPKRIRLRLGGASLLNERKASFRNSRFTKGLRPATPPCVEVRALLLKPTGGRAAQRAAMINNALVTGFALLLVRFIAAEAAFQRAKRVGSSTHFPVGFGLRLLFRIGGPFLIFVGYKMTEQASGLFDWTTAILVAAMGLGCILAEPGEIISTPTGLVQKSLLGLRMRTIPWNGAAASHPRGLREVLVVGGTGTTITHSQYHVGQGEFLLKLEQHQVYVQS
jgi:hypothetical protein